MEISQGPVLCASRTTSFLSSCSRHAEQMWPSRGNHSLPDEVCVRVKGCGKAYEPVVANAPHAPRFSSVLTHTIASPGLQLAANVAPRPGGGERFQKPSRPAAQ